MKSLFVALTLVLTTFPVLAQQFERAEPAYCDLKTFKSLEVKSAVGGLPRLHAYQIGRLLLTGLAVGDANTNTLIKFDTHYSNVSSANKYCTWYFNEGNSAAEKAFTHKLLSKPTSIKVASEYMSKVGSAFDQDSINMVDCAERNGLIAMGCNGMKHRGPTAFGMLLAYSGCSAKSANLIVNTVWGTNGIPVSVREQLMQKAFDLGVAHSEKSTKLRNQMLAN